MYSPLDQSEFFTAWLVFVVPVRQMIMSGCAAFAQVVDPTRIEAELLPQWWEQVNAIIIQC